MRAVEIALSREIESIVIIPEQYRTPQQHARLTDLKIQLALVQREPKCCATDIDFTASNPNHSPNLNSKLKDTYYVIDSATPEMQNFSWLDYYGPNGLGYELPLHLLESEQQGQNVPWLICDNTLTYEGIVLGLEDDVRNGWEDLEEVTPE